MRAACGVLPGLKVSKGDFITNSSTNKRTRVPRLVRIHSDELEDIPSAVGGAKAWKQVVFVARIRALAVWGDVLKCGGGRSR